MHEPDEYNMELSLLGGITMDDQNVWNARRRVNLGGLKPANIRRRDGKGF